MRKPNSGHPTGSPLGAWRRDRDDRAVPGRRASPSNVATARWRRGWSRRCWSRATARTPSRTCGGGRAGELSSWRRRPRRGRWTACGASGLAGSAVRPPGAVVPGRDDVVDDQHRAADPPPGDEGRAGQALDGGSGPGAAARPSTRRSRPARTVPPAATPRRRVAPPAGIVAAAGAAGLAIGRPRHDASTSVPAGLRAMAPAQRAHHRPGVAVLRRQSSRRQPGLARAPPAFGRVARRRPDRGRSASTARDRLGGTRGSGRAGATAVRSSEGASGFRRRDPVIDDTGVASGIVHIENGPRQILSNQLPPAKAPGEPRARCASGSAGAPRASALPSAAVRYGKPASGIGDTDQ